MILEIRPFVAADWPEVWTIVRDVVEAADTFPYDPAMTEPQAQAMWIEAPPGLTVVATHGERVLGTAKMGPNGAGPGAHVSTASFMVAAEYRGRGVGTALCGHALGWARVQGFLGMQFNAVVETNGAAVHVYRQHGFRIIGTVPRAFRRPRGGAVGLHLMYRDL